MSWVGERLQDLWDWGEDEIRAAADNHKNREGTSAHISAQNQATAEMTAALALYHQNPTPANANSTIRIFEKIDQTFQIYAARLGYSRALQGAADVHALAARVIADLRLEATGIPIPGGIPFPGSTADLSNWPTLALIGGAAFLLLRRR